MTRDPLTSIGIDALFQLGRASNAVQVSKQCRLRTQERIDETRRTIVASRRSLDASWIQSHEGGGE